MHPYRKLLVWQKAHQALLAAYRATEAFPASQRYRLVDQIRRAALSVPTNIVEGSKRLTKKDFAHFLNIAETAAAEVGYLFEVSPDLGLISREAAAVLREKFDELERMLYALRKRVLQ